MSTSTVPAKTTTLAWQQIEVGDEVTPLDFAVTTSRIVAGAIASRDYMPVHHDRDFAQGQGSKDIFLNILSSNGLAVRFLTDWAGPEAMVRKLSIRLGAPAYPNDPLHFVGSVTDKREEHGEGLIEVSFTATNSLGAHAIGTAVLSFVVDSGA